MGFGRRRQISLLLVIALIALPGCTRDPKSHDRSALTGATASVTPQPAALQGVKRGEVVYQASDWSIHAMTVGGQND